MSNFTASPDAYRYKEGDFFIGETEKGDFLGITSKRHAITVAGSRTGKGVGVINANLRTWPHNVLVIDPKGEAATVSWEARKNKGQAVYVLDPFERAKVPDECRAAYNPLADLNPDSLTIKEDIGAIADGIVMRSGDPGAVVWDNGAVQLLTGVIAYVLTACPPHKQNLISVRQILTDQREGELFDTAIDEMANAHDGVLADLMRAGASRANSKEGDYYVSGAIANTDWLDSQGMQNILSRSSFSMRELKQGKASVFVALPFKYLPQQQHGRFLRLMVRCGISAMQEPMPDGSDMGERCLFILDEFFSLGYIDEVATSIGGMASYGLHLWPFLQDLDQLWKLYGRDGAGTFFGSSDLHQFFGVTDPETLKFISERVGVFTIDELPPEPTLEGAKKAFNYDAEWQKNKAALDEINGRKHRAGDDIAGRMYAGRNLDLSHAVEREYHERLARFNTDASRILGKPRLAPDQVAHMIRLEENAPTAEAQIAFVRGVKPLICKLSKYFEWTEPPKEQEVMVINGKTVLVADAIPMKNKSGFTYKNERDFNDLIIRNHENLEECACAVCYVCGQHETIGKYDWKPSQNAPEEVADSIHPCSYCGHECWVKFPARDPETGDWMPDFQSLWFFKGQTDHLRPRNAPRWKFWR